MKVKRDDTEESRRYWQMMEENSKVVASWPEWKRGARPAQAAQPAEASALSPDTGAALDPSGKK